MRSGRPTVETTLTLDINRLVRLRLIQPGRLIADVLVWTNTGTGEVASKVAYEADLRDPAAASVRLRYFVAGQSMTYSIELDCTPMRFGGCRWWWRCPASGRRAVKLHLAHATGMFVHREMAGLAYQTWRDRAVQRSHTRQRRLHARLRANYDASGAEPERPKGMHQTTYEALLTQLDLAAELHDAACMRGLRRWLGVDEAAR